jgi:hypothetical protein
LLKHGSWEPGATKSRSDEQKEKFRKMLSNWSLPRVRIEVF